MEDFLNFLITNNKAVTGVGVLLTVFISSLSLGFTVKNNKAMHYVNSVTQNRVEWIDKLRRNVSEFLALLDTQDLTDGIAEIDGIIKYPFGTKMQRLNQIGTEIKLMLNFADEFDEEIMCQISYNITL